VTRSSISSPSAFRFVVRLTPKGGRDSFEGWQPDAAGRQVLKARVSAPPEDGKANAALIELVAGALRIAKSKVRIVSGLTARVKTVEVEGDGALLSARLAQAGRAA
jgi:uncharacterized protein